MKQIDYIMRVKEVGDDDSKAWDEKTSKIVNDNINIVDHAKDAVFFFNSYRKPGEKERMLVSVSPIEATEEANLPHDWGKVSLMTEKGGYDKMRCKRCGVTGKRYGLGANGAKLDKECAKEKFCKY